MKSNKCLIDTLVQKSFWKTEPDAVLEKKKEKYLESLQRRRLTPHIVAYTDQTNAKIQNLCVIVAKCFRQETGAKRSLYIFVSYSSRTANIVDFAKVEAFVLVILC